MGKEGRIEVVGPPRCPRTYSLTKRSKTPGQSEGLRDGGVSYEDLCPFLSPPGVAVRTQ